MTRSSRLLRLVAVLFVAAGSAACGSGEDRPGQVTSENNGSGSGSGSGSASGSASGTGSSASSSAGDEGYTPVSDVDAHAAIGEDVEDIKALLALAKESKPVDWAGVTKIWSEGGASKKGDGSNRTLASLVEAPDVTAFVDAAIAGQGSNGSVGSDAVRAQHVEKGITVLLARKVVDELEAAEKKVAAGQTEDAGGAPHNVDEGWAFLTAEGHGPAATAEKRAADFNRDGKVLEPILESLTKAQAAARKGDAQALGAARTDVAEGLSYVFYLATHKYLAAPDEVGRAEGRAFYLGIQPAVKEASASADEAIVAAFASADATGSAAGRAALHEDAVLAALGVEANERVDKR